MEDEETCARFTGAESGSAGLHRLADCVSKRPSNYLGTKHMEVVFLIIWGVYGSVHGLYDYLASS